MALIELKEVAHAYMARPRRPEDYALKRFDMMWQDGAAYALLGPSGCGKTTTLNIISGIIRPSEGRVLIDDRDVTANAPRDRNDAQVFHSPENNDTMTEFDNLAFPLRNRKVDRDEIGTRVHEVAEMLELTADLKRRASGLTADTKQKISLGRGLVRKDVAAILFDEPLTVIDPHLKWLLRRKLKQIHEQFNTTLIYVTHDQNEALSFADQVVMMNQGEVLQTGSPQELFENPSHTFVGYFIGSPGMNHLPCQIDGDAAIVEGAPIALGEGIAERGRAAGGELVLGIRPEFLRLSNSAEQGNVPVNVRLTENLGHFKIVTVSLGKLALKVKVPEDQDVPGDWAYLEFPPEWTKVYADGRLVE